MPIKPGFTEADLREQADSRSFERGRGYLSQVSDLDITDTGVTATVSGTDDYDVWLAPADQGLRWSCSCPFGQDGSFCKHCVAVGLSALAPGATEQVTATRARRDAVGAWLESLSRDDLVAELRGLLRDDPDLRRRFELRAAAASGDALAVRRTTRALITPMRGGYIACDEADAYAEGVYEVAAAIDRLAKAGGGAQAIAAAREAIEELERAFERLDDSNGAIGGAAQELLAAHLRACQAEPPEPRALARYLAGRVLDDPYGVAPDLTDYTGLLGPAGLAELRAEITGAGAGRWVLEGLLRAEGNVDDLVALHAAHLDDLGRGHLAIARELDAAGRGDEALAWAERGLREAGRPDGPLVEYLADRYAAAGRPEDVLALRRDRFAADRTLRGYQRLRQAAVAGGRWPAEREPALALLTADARVPRPRPVGTSPDWTGPVLIDALLDEGDADAAWAAAQQVPDATSPGQWLRLADLAAPARPADALAVYLRLIEPLRARTGEKVYEQVARLLRAARGCHQALGTSAEFERYLAWLREDQKRKPNLMRMLDHAGLTAAARGRDRAERLR